MAVIRLKSKAALQRLSAASKKAARRTAKARPRLVIAHKPATVTTHSDGMIEIILPIRLTNGNDGRTKHYRPTKKFRDECGLQCRAWFPDRQPCDVPVTVEVMRLLAKGERKMDQSSLGRGNWKEIEDSLVAAGWFHDDNSTWITSVQFSQNDTQRLDYSRISVRIRKAKAV